MPPCRTCCVMFDERCRALPSHSWAWGAHAPEAATLHPTASSPRPALASLCLPQRRVLRWVRQLASEQTVLQSLEEAGAVPYVVAQLRRQGDPELQVNGCTHVCGSSAGAACCAWCGAVAAGPVKLQARWVTQTPAGAWLACTHLSLTGHSCTQPLLHTGRCLGRPAQPMPAQPLAAGAGSRAEGGWPAGRCCPAAGTTDRTGAPAEGAASYTAGRRGGSGGMGCQPWAGGVTAVCLW